MVFDDHDVTDDWNLSRAWRDRVLHLARWAGASSPRPLVAYALFQDWGNDPKRYLQKAPAREPARRGRWSLPKVARDGPRDPRGGRQLEKLFALNQPDPEPAPELKWHFTIDGPRHRVVALDTRTRRVYRSRHPAARAALAGRAQGTAPRSKPSSRSRRASRCWSSSRRRRRCCRRSSSGDRPLMTRLISRFNNHARVAAISPAPSRTTRSGRATSRPMRSFLEAAGALQTRGGALRRGPLRLHGPVEPVEKGHPRLTLPANLESALNSGPLPLLLW